MTHTYVISRSNDDDRYGVWEVDPTGEDLLTPVAIDPHAVFGRRNGLTAVGGYLLASTPLDHELQQFGFRLVAFDPDCPDPLHGRPVQEGFWDKEKFWNYYEYRNCPDEHQVDDLRLIGITGYVLSFLPTAGRGSFDLWNFDAASDNPGGSTDPLPAPMTGPGAFPTIGPDHVLLPMGNYVLDWVPGERRAVVYSFDPQLANPLSEPAVWSGAVPGHDDGQGGDLDENGHDRMTVVDRYLLTWSSSSLAYTLYRFDPRAPFSDAVRHGTLPPAFDAATTLTSVQTLATPSSAAASAGSSAVAPGTIEFMRDRIKHVVYYVLESRSFDSVVGWLYDQGTDGVNWVHADAPFQGADPTHTNVCGDETYRQYQVHHGEISVDKHLREPMLDPFHDTPDSIRQQWSGGYPAYRAGEPADMQGFVRNNGFKAVMAGYTPDQLPVLNGLAEQYALSDEWFCSEAGGTTANRATIASGSAYNITASYESGPAYTFFPERPRRPSIWKVLANNGITDWRIYYSVLWGTPPYPYTYHLYLRGQVPSIDGQWQGYVQPIRSFLHAAQSGQLPKFSYLEPVWFDPSGTFTSYHPTGDVIPGEVALNEIYNAIKDGPGWNETVLVISFSKGGGLYDHVPSPRLPKAWPNDGLDGYDFDVAGTRVPTIVVSPWVEPNTVFRSSTDTPFDGTSLAATVLRWFGVPEARWGLGDRVPQAPTFETVLQASRPRRDPPVFGRSFDATYPPDAKVHTAPTVKSHWHIRPGTGRWTNPANWRSGKVPTGRASFGDSEQRTIGFKKGSALSVKRIKFEPDAPAFTFVFDESRPDDPTLTITGKGVDNQSEEIQTFRVEATSLQTWQTQLVFANAATAGNERVRYHVGPKRRDGRSGAIITFRQMSNAGRAHFTVRTGAKPTSNSTVGGEIRFDDDSSAGEATFTAYGTLGSDGDTFGNVVFHNRAGADRARFTNIGGTVSRGDGGNTQFFDTTSAEHARIVNKGGTTWHANGGDTAFDGTATASCAQIVNEAAPHEGAYGGVTSFNNNWPPMAITEGATAGNALIDNRAATSSEHGSGGHTKFTGMYGAGNGGDATITNRGTNVANNRGAGNTQFTISAKAKRVWRPSAGHATIINEPGGCRDARGGYTVFACYDFDGPIPPGPTAGHATITSLGGTSADAPGGVTTFEGTSTAGDARLIATGGTMGGWGGLIRFFDQSSGDNATIRLQGGDGRDETSTAQNGRLDVTRYGLDELSVGVLEIDGGTIACSVGDDLTTIVVTRSFTLESTSTWFDFTPSPTGFATDTDFRLLKADALSSLDARRFGGNPVDGHAPRFRLAGDELFVSFAA